MLAGFLLSLAGAWVFHLPSFASTFRLGLGCYVVQITLDTIYSALSHKSSTNLEKCPKYFGQLFMDDNMTNGDWEAIRGSQANLLLEKTLTALYGLFASSRPIAPISFD